MRFLSFFVALFISQFTFAGVEISGGGGNGVKAQFLNLAKDSLTILANRTMTSETTTKFNAREILQSLKSITITPSESSLTLNGQNVSAINYPSRNEIVISMPDWLALDRTSKIQLVLHEIIGLTHRSVLDDSDYSISRELTALTLLAGVENLALNIATANYYQNQKPRVQTERTKAVHKFRDASGEFGIVTEVCVQTFENSSKKSVRVYWIYEDNSGAVVKIQLVRTEGPVGP